MFFTKCLLKTKRDYTHLFKITPDSKTLHSGDLNGCYCNYVISQDQGCLGDARCIQGHVTQIMDAKMFVIRVSNQINY